MGGTELRIKALQRAENSSEFSACHLFCFRNTPYMLALLGQFMFGLVLYIRNSDLVYYFTYVEGNGDFLTIYSLITIVPALIGAAAFPVVFMLWLRRFNRKD